MKRQLFILFLLSTFVCFGQATLVQDINLGTFSSNPSNKAEFNGFVYFIANDGINGAELWRTDGTENGTEIFKEFVAGSENGIAAITPFVSNNLLYFFAADSTDYFLWKTDGTDAGTEKVKQFTSIQAFHETINNELVFTAENKFWKTDGTESGTIKLADFSVFGNTRFVKSGNEIYFSGEPSFSVGQELYKTDGTTVSLVKDIYPTTNKDSYPNNFAALNGIVYFSADNGTNGFELWKSDGTEAGTEMVKDINPGSGSTFSTSTPIKVYNNKLFFTYGTELWTSDGTDVGTTKLLDLESNVKAMVIFNSKIHVFMYSNAFWVSDGTVAGSEKIETTTSEFFHNSQYAVVGNQLFFQSNNECGYEIWKTDGTAEGSFMVKDIHPEFDDNNIEGIIGLNGKAIFTASDKNWYGKELWISDGTENGTTILKDINQQGSNDSSPKNYFQFNDKVLFSADNGENGRELWVINTGVASLLKDINPGPRYSNPSNFILFNNDVYFSASTKEKGKEIWKTDGTETGTVLFKDINPDKENGLGNSNFVVLNNKLYFFANDGTNGMELWETGGTDANTKMVLDINGTDTNSISNSALEILNSELFFVANDGTNGTELYKSDGTASGTVLVKDINTNGNSNVRNLNVHTYTDQLYFSAYDGSETTLWRTGGTEANTVKLAIKNVDNFTYSGSRDVGKRGSPDIKYNTELFFTGESTSNFNKKGTELWAITYTGSVQAVHDINPGDVSSYPSLLTNHNWELYFMAYEPTNGYELWKASYYQAELVKDTNSGTANGNINEIVSFGDVVLFGAGDNSQNRELWKSDGTSEGTTLFQDINPLTPQYGNGSNPSSFFEHNNVLYFSANNGAIGSELWQLEKSALSTEKQFLNELAKVTLYPNPTSNILNLKVENQQIKSVKVFNLLGKEVMHLSSINENINKIDISHFTNGIYILQVKTDTDSYTKKIIKN
jgi:ELWxxDGT repeat protein